MSSIAAFEEGGAMPFGRRKRGRRGRPGDDLRAYRTPRIIRVAELAIANGFQGTGFVSAERISEYIANAKKAARDDGWASQLAGFYAEDMMRFMMTVPELEALFKAESPELILPEPFWNEIIYKG
jgi:hypothetical protein